MATIQKIRPHLWFTKEAEKAADYYISIFKKASLGRVARYTEAGKDIHKMKPGTISTVEVKLLGQDFVFLNGGPLFKFNESISFMISCDTQDEIDYYWEKLKQGGDPKAQQCGWLKDKYEVSWQVSPPQLEKN